MGEGGMSTHLSGFKTNQAGSWVVSMETDLGLHCILQRRREVTCNQDFYQKLLKFLNSPMLRRNSTFPFSKTKEWNNIPLSKRQSVTVNTLKVAVWSFKPEIRLHAN